MSLIDDYPVLKLCAEGKSNRSISNRLEISVEEISCILGEHYSFSGFVKDLDINPRIVYNRNKYNQYKFIQECQIFSPLLTDLELRLAFKVNQEFDKVERINYA